MTVLRQHKKRIVLPLIVVTVLLGIIYCRQVPRSNRLLTVLSTMEESTKVLIKSRTHSESVQATLGPGYKVETLTRLGSDLKFDQQSCPTGSVMINSTLANSSPLHDDCPTLFIVGAKKGGTTSLIQYLSKHPDFEGPSLHKGIQSGGTQFFNKKFEKQTWEKYLTNFPTESGRRFMTGESTVGYLVHCSVPQRIFEYCGRQAKIVMLLRNPIDRFVSNFQMRIRVAKRYKDKYIAEFVNHDVYLHGTNREHSAATSQDLLHRRISLRCELSPGESMIYEGLYYIHLMNWLCNFPAENIMIVNSEQFFQNTSTILKQTFQFLGLNLPPEESYKRIAAKVYNRARSADFPSHQQLTEVLRRKLRMVYEPFNKALFELLDWNDLEWT